MVGDLVEKWLTRAGVTKERVERWTRTAGRPGGCGCEGRRRWLNERGAQVQVAARKALLRVWAVYMPGIPVDGYKGDRSRYRHAP